MADLSNPEKRNLEKLLSMGSGYVLNFSNRTFEEFVFDSSGKHIYDALYETGGGSKANRLRAFWTSEPNHVVGKLLADLVDYAQETNAEPTGSQLLESCRRIAERLQSDGPVLEIETLVMVSSERDFATLARSVKESIAANQPEAGLDRLHTFVTKYMRGLCSRHGTDVAKDEPLHSLFGKYVKALKAEGHITSEMTERILKSSIATFEAFNHVRNNHSLAHDNPTLNYDESVLILNHVTGCVRFTEAIERRIAPPAPVGPPEQAPDDDVPF